MIAHQLLTLLTLTCLLVCGCAPGDEPVKEKKDVKDDTSADIVKTESGLKYQELRQGSGTASRKGDMVEVHYTGWLTDGTKFDSSLDRGQPFSFTLGAKQVIPGWDEGVAGMKVGGKRKLMIPSKLGYGERGTPGGPIPPNADLVFEVELLMIR